MRRRLSLPPAPSAPLLAVFIVGGAFACGSGGAGGAASGKDAGGTLDASVGVDAPVADGPAGDGSIADAPSYDGSAPPPDGSACAPFVPDAKLAAAREACTFASGDHPGKTLDDATAARTAIQHLLIVAHENRSFDHMYGTLGGGFEGYPASYSNPTPDGGVAIPQHAPTACPPDISHSATSIHAEWNDGGMNGFFDTDGPEALWHYDTADHPFYSWLMTTFSASDRYFCSTLSQTGDNRRFLYGASSTQVSPNIFSEMTAAGVTWANYYAGADPIYNTYSWPVGYPNTYPYKQALSDIDAGKLPAVSYVDTSSDEHPPGSMKYGEAVIRDLLTHAFASPLWPHMAIVFTYDEGGGFFDHVPPPRACLPSKAAADADYGVLGIRVPLVIVSPFARKGYVSHTVHSHTSTMRLVELLHDLPAASDRDANSDALLDMFDFACPDFATPPSLPALGPIPDSGCP
jgi:phospholipase C